MSKKGGCSLTTTTSNPFEHRFVLSDGICAPFRGQSCLPGNKKLKIRENVYQLVASSFLIFSFITRLSCLMLHWIRGLILHLCRFGS